MVCWFIPVSLPFGCWGWRVAMVGHKSWLESKTMSQKVQLMVMCALVISWICIYSTCLWQNHWRIPQYFKCQPGGGDAVVQYVLSSTCKPGTCASGQQVLSDLHKQHNYEEICPKNWTGCSNQGSSLTRLTPPFPSNLLSFLPSVRGWKGLGWRKTVGIRTQ